ncbi:MAG: BatD family protein [Proteobacteria bacterium]|nr:BatD family protein [Pseudomonadota bacterium]MBU1688136.1 BatD family protein [Pseudomonadota bacterium]
MRDWLGRIFLGCVLIALVVISGNGALAGEGVAVPPAKTQPEVQLPTLVETVTSGPYRLTRTLNRNSLSVADRLELTLTAEGPEDVVIDLPSPEGALGDFTLLENRDQAPKLIGKDRQQVSRTYLLEPYLAGDYSLPPLVVSFQSKNGLVENVKSEAIQFTVVSLLDANPNQTIGDIVEPVAQPLNPWIVAAWIGGGLFIIALLGAVIFFLIRRRRNRPPPPPPSPREVARRELDQLLGAGLLGQGLIKEFHLRLSHILRHYLENRFGLRAPEQTTEEFLTDLGHRRELFDTKLHGLLRHFLTQCDLVKFARSLPSTEEIDHSIEICREIIDSATTNATRESTS